MNYLQALTLGISILVILACSGCVGGGSDVQVFENDWGKVQFELPKNLPLTSVVDRQRTVLSIEETFQPLIYIDFIDYASQTETPISLVKRVTGWTDPNTDVSNDGHKIYWRSDAGMYFTKDNSDLDLPPGARLLRGYIDYTADKNLLVRFLAISIYADPSSGKYIDAFDEEGFLKMLKSFTFLESKVRPTAESESTKPTETTQVQPTEEDQVPIFHMAVIGDSVAWGNGLKDSDKYSYLVADWIEEKLNASVNVAVYAHSGAKISGESGEVIDPSLNSGSPTLKDQAISIKDKDDIELILVSGGINDVGVQNIFDPNTPADTVIVKLSESIKNNMSDLLKYLLDQTNAKIIVTGYYPLITEQSNVDSLAQGVASLLALKSDRTASQMNAYINAIVNPLASNDKATLWKDVFNSILNRNENLRSNSDTFYAISSNSLKQAVADVDRGGDRVIFVDPRFGRNNSYGASNSFLWELEWVMTKDALKLIKTNDDQYEIRFDLAKETYPSNLFKQAENIINPVAHPNRDGAAKYAKTIEFFMEKKGLDWLQKGITIDSGVNTNQETTDSDTTLETGHASETPTPPDDNEGNTKTAYTKDGINFISEERLEQNIRNGFANLGEYEKVQVPLDTKVMEASPE